MYTVTNVGSGSTNWVLTRDTNYDETVNSGLSVYIREGTDHARQMYTLTTADPIVVDTTPQAYENVLTYVQAYLSRDSSFSIITGNVGNIPIDSKLLNGIIYNGSDELTITAPGIYKISCYLEYTTTATGTFNIQMRINNTTPPAEYPESDITITYNANVTSFASAFTTRSLNSNDKITLYLNTADATAVTANAISYSVVKIE